MRKVLFTLAVLFTVALGTSSCSSSSDSFEEVIEETQFDSSTVDSEDDENDGDTTPGN